MDSTDLEKFPVMVPEIYDRFFGPSLTLLFTDLAICSVPWQVCASRFNTSPRLNFTESQMRNSSCIGAVAFSRPLARADFVVRDVTEAVAALTAALVNLTEGRNESEVNGTAVQEIYALLSNASGPVVGSYPMFPVPGWGGRFPLGRTNSNKIDFFAWEGAYYDAGTGNLTRVQAGRSYRLGLVAVPFVDAGKAAVEYRADFIGLIDVFADSDPDV